MKRTVKRSVLPLLLLASVLFLVHIPASADLIAEPYESEFYAEHKDECRQENGLYEINALGGVRLMEDPESEKVLRTYETVGEYVWVSLIWQNPAGGSWAFLETIDQGKLVTGWIPMSCLWKSYDEDMFRREYNSEIVSESGSFLPDEDTTIMVYRYPGSTDVQEITVTADTGEPPVYNITYKDEEGRTWAFLWNYEYSGWTCLDAPEASFEELWPEGAPVIDHRERTFYELSYDENETVVREIADPRQSTASETEKNDSTEQTETKEEPSAPNKSGIPFAAFLGGIGGIAVVTLILLFVLIRRRKNRI